jgi:lipid II:glycine glycyltransferase (peptidoglycan interpeptide bridge formation enzyme)
MHSNSSLAASRSFWVHTLDLGPPLDQIFGGFDKNCVRRRIRRAERGQLAYEKGNSEEILSDFYRLLMMTRRRHQIVPQPREWFRNLIEFLGDDVEIRMVRKDTTPVAAILTITHCKKVIYKYGCSDGKFHYLGGMPFLFWKLIAESKAAGANQVDFGRTDLENHGLIRFKDEFGAERRQLTYLRYPERASGKYITSSDLPRTRRLFSVLPDVISSGVGRLLYRHMG